MLLDTVQETVEAVGLKSQRHFGIAATAKAFEILSSKLYQNQILAVIREVSCNAADAHKVTGRPIADIEIHMPTFTEPFFSVRDYGPGMSAEAIENLYTTYFMSDKDSNNDMIGGFGLGSKSPFAVADQFTVTSWHNGRRHDYVMFKENGCPDVSEIANEPSDEPSGMLVRVAATNYSAWAIEAQTFFAWWPEKPTFVPALTIGNVFREGNVAFQSDTKVEMYPEWAFFHHQVGSTKIKAFMGLVMYSIDLSAIPNLPPGLAQVTTFGAGNLVCSFAIGALSVNPSRETLTYDTRTCKAIIDKLEKIQTALTVQMQDALDKQPDLFAARNFVWGPQGLNHFRRASAYSSRNQPAYTWKTKPVLARVALDTNGPKNIFAEDLAVTEMYYRGHTKNKWRKGNLYGDAMLDNSINSWHKEEGQYYVWVPKPVTGKTYRKVYHYFEEQRIAHNQSQPSPIHGFPLNTVTLVAGSTYADVVKVLAEAGFPPILDGSAFPDAPAAPVAARRASATTRGYIWKHTANGNFDWERQESTLDLTKPKSYVSFFNGAPENVDMTPIRKALAMGWVDNTTEFVGFKRAQLASDRFQKKLKTFGWELLDPAKWWQTNVKADDLRRAAKLTNLRTFCTTHGNAQAASTLVQFIQWRADGETYTYSAALEKLLAEDIAKKLAASFYTNNGIPPALSYNNVAQAASVQLGNTEAVACLSELGTFMDKHPMLWHVDWNKAKKLDFKTFLAYINR